MMPFKFGYEVLTNSMCFIFSLLNVKSIRILRPKRKEKQQNIFDDVAKLLFINNKFSYKVICRHKTLALVEMLELRMAKQTHEPNIYENLWKCE